MNNHHLLFKTLFIFYLYASTYPITAMDEKMHLYGKMLHNIAASSKNNPSITLINNNQFSFTMKIGDIEKDGIRSTIPLHKNTRFTFSPYTHPFFLNQEYLSEGTIIKLITPDKCCFKLHIDIHSMQSGDVIRLDYDECKNILNPVRNDPNDLKPKKFQKTLKRSKDNLLLPKRSNTVT